MARMVGSETVSGLLTWPTPAPGRGFLNLAVENCYNVDFRQYIFFASWNMMSALRGIKKWRKIFANSSYDFLDVFVCLFHMFKCILQSVF